MFARSVTVHLKTNIKNDFNTTVESTVVPLLRKQPGFRDLISLVDENGTEVTSISLWDNRESAEAYNRTAYKEVVTKLQNFIEGQPIVRVSTVGYSTIHKISSGKAA